MRNEAVTDSINVKYEYLILNKIILIIIIV